MELIEKYIKTNYHTVLNCEKQDNRLIITTMFGEIINIGKLSKDEYEVFITTVMGDDCDYQSYVFDIFELFKMLDVFVNNFYRGSDIVLDAMLEAREAANEL